ncbi:hypothetical protein [Pseudidiomarina homiensis]|uniref:hypothetical protein n=1 Tax=Pseudidiomarina homiensis TaxID=364198 RepID=UPI00215AF98D|nr:hypothetical protein [Pseudidiomarina homiensis]
MNKKQPKLKIYELIEEYSGLNRDICALTLLLVVMIFTAAMFAAWYIFSSDVDGTWRSAQTVGVLVSALIISKTASRHICHTEILRKNESDVSVVQRTHQAMAVIADLRQRVVFVKGCFEGNDRPLMALSKNVKSIEAHYQFFYNRELYELLPPNALKIIESMSGSIFGLCTVVEVLVQKHDLTASVPPVKEKHNGGDMQDAIDSLLSEINSLDDEIRRIRASVGR